MSNFTHSIRQLIARILGQPSSRERKKDELVQGLMKALRDSREREIGCDEVYEVLDQYAEAVLKGVDTAELMPLVNHHIHMCHECREELEMLMEMLRLQMA